jgi:hypothetical protein
MMNVAPAYISKAESIKEKSPETFEEVKAVSQKRRKAKETTSAQADKHWLSCASCP